MSAIKTGARPQNNNDTVKRNRTQVYAETLEDIRTVLQQITKSLIPILKTQSMKRFFTALSVDQKDLEYQQTVLQTIFSQFEKRLQSADPVIQQYLHYLASYVMEQIGEKISMVTLPHELTLLVTEVIYQSETVTTHLSLFNWLISDHIIPLVMDEVCPSDTYTLKMLTMYQQDCRKQATALNNSVQAPAMFKKLENLVPRLEAQFEKGNTVDESLLDEMLQDTECINAIKDYGHHVAVLPNIKLEAYDEVVDGATGEPLFPIPEGKRASNVFRMRLVKWEKSFSIDRIQKPFRASFDKKLSEFCTGPLKYMVRKLPAAQLPEPISLYKELVIGNIDSLAFELSTDTRKCFASFRKALSNIQTSESDLDLDSASNADLMDLLCPFVDRKGVSSICRSEKVKLLSTYLHPVTQPDSKVSGSFSQKTNAHMLTLKALTGLALKYQEFEDRLGESWLLLVAAHECCLSSITETSLESPQLESETVQQSIYNLFEAMWQKQCWGQIENIATMSLKGKYSHYKECAVEAFQSFVAKKKDLNLVPKETSVLLFLDGVLHLHQQNILPGLSNIHKALWICPDIFQTSTVNIVRTLLVQQPKLVFPIEIFQSFCEAGFGGLLDLEKVECLTPLRFSESQLKPPLSSNTCFYKKTLCLQRKNITHLGAMLHELAIASQVEEGMLTFEEAALKYLDILASGQSYDEKAVCLLNAALWFLKTLQVNSQKMSSSKIYALKTATLSCIHQAFSLSRNFCCLGRQFYVNRLAFQTTLETLHLAEDVATDNDSRLLIRLAHALVYSSRFCPVLWYANIEPVPMCQVDHLSVLFNRFHKLSIRQLEESDPNDLTVHKSELQYELLEDTLRNSTNKPLLETRRVTAMEEMLAEKGWSMKDVENLMSSPLSPRDAEGWLIQQNVLGVPLEFAELKGFVIDMKGAPSISIRVVPAREGKPGLFSIKDAQMFMQLESNVSFGLYPPNISEKFHPFLDFWYSSEKLKDTDILHTLFQADYLLKSWSSGVDISSKPPFKQRLCKENLTKNLPISLQKILTPTLERECYSSHHISHSGRIWIEVGHMYYDSHTTVSQMQLQFGEVKMVVRSHPMVQGLDGKLRDTKQEDDPNSPCAQVAKDLTEHYDELSGFFPILARLRELSKLHFMRLTINTMLQQLRLFKGVMMIISGLKKVNVAGQVIALHLWEKRLNQEVKRLATAPVLPLSKTPSCKWVPAVIYQNVWGGVDLYPKNFFCMSSSASHTPSEPSKVSSSTVAESGDADPCPKKLFHMSSSASHTPSEPSKVSSSTVAESGDADPCPKNLFHMSSSASHTPSEPSSSVSNLFNIRHILESLARCAEGGEPVIEHRFIQSEEEILVNLSRSI